MATGMPVSHGHPTLIAYFTVTVKIPLLSCFQALTK